MNIIPVLDLKAGQVVHAKHGDRQNYLPIQSALSNSSEPLAIVKALQSLYPFKHLYIADLDAIQGSGSHVTQIKNIQKYFPDLEIWLDAGFNTIEAIEAWQNSKVRIVLGSESLVSIDHYKAMLNSCKTSPILSLDFKSGQFLGTQALINDTRLWPNEVIAMTLDQVGSQSGPDLAQLKVIKNLSPAAAIYAAGGIRSVDDLNTLKAQNYTGALIASALHNGKIGKADLARLI
jgi:phosphoribosylformimino-5-aminoimidazole carboxamide ribotide isomerase